MGLRGKRKSAAVRQHFGRSDLGGCPSRRTVLLINPPVYDTQYWAQWSQPYGLLRIAALLKKHRYKRIEQPMGGP